MKMDFDKMYLELILGEKVRRKSWPMGHYIYFEPADPIGVVAGIIRHSHVANFHLSIAEFDALDWELINY